MINNAEETWKQYVDAGVNLIIAHIEAVQDFSQFIKKVRQTDVQVGCVLNPETPASDVLALIPDLDLLLVMSVVPGKGGQSFIPEMENKIRYFRKIIDTQVQSGGRATKLMIDGGIKSHNAAKVADWGVDVAVVGSGLINNKGSIKSNLNSIYEALNN